MPIYHRQLLRYIYHSRLIKCDNIKIKQQLCLPDFMSTRSIFPYFPNKRSRSDWRESYPKLPTKIGLIVATTPTKCTTNNQITQNKRKWPYNKHKAPFGSWENTTKKPSQVVYLPSWEPKTEKTIEERIFLWFSSFPRNQPEEKEDDEKLKKQKSARNHRARGR